MKVVDKNVSVNVDTGERHDAVIGEGERISAVLSDFKREMEEHVIPEVVKVIRRRHELAQESRKWIIGSYS